jgi:hydroxymethylbilane synthase
MLIRAATRGSALALWQTDRVGELISTAIPGAIVEAVVVHTSGDLDQATPIEQMGGTGVFAKEVQAAVLDGRADIAVHSAKDLTSTPPEGLFIVAFLERADVRDGLVGGTLSGLANGAVVATGSIRRKAQLAALRPDLEFVGLRGNMTTRLAKLGEVDAIVAACAGLDRLGLGHRIDDRLDPSVFVPQVGQGALAIECRADDAATRDALSRIDDAEVRATVSAERAYLAELGGGCDLPVGAYSVLEGSVIHLDALLASFDGSTVLRASGDGTDPHTLGVGLAHELLDLGGRELLNRS